ncbi:agmatinase family protein [Cytobacillus sp. FJAT-54145]|uniref:Agmatinase family protein n=1 Tax=Cytobacillus spartinae TaxID=3299023 RepID=A0ABW6K5N1_9BACI
MLSIPLNPPPFYWPESSKEEDMKVHEWIKQSKSIIDDREQHWDVVLFGAPLSRSSISVSGASEFPYVFRQAWKGFSTYNIDDDLDLKDLRIIDIGDVKMHGTVILLSHENIKNVMCQVHQWFSNTISVTVGGDHSVTAMLVKGLKEQNFKKTIGILQFDTHLDVRDLSVDGPTNGTPIRNLIESNTIIGDHVYNIGLHGFFNSSSLVKYAKDNDIHYITLKQARLKGLQKTVRDAICELETKVDQIHVTVDMDVLDISFAPGVPASTPGGMTTEELFDAVRLSGMSNKVKSMDIVCLDPTKDTPSLPTVKAGISTFLSFLTGVMKRSPI